jgi:hypothetical protein
MGGVAGAHGGANRRVLEQPRGDLAPNVVERLEVLADEVGLRRRTRRC